LQGLKSQAFIGVAFLTSLYSVVGGGQELGKLNLWRDAHVHEASGQNPLPFARARARHNRKGG
jgi:hypothetical protein